MVRASDCGPEGRRFDPDIPPHSQLQGYITSWEPKRPKGQTVLPDIPPQNICECSTAVSIQVFQTWDEVSTTSTRTKKTPLRGDFIYFGSNKNATVPAAAPRIIVMRIVTINPTFESFSGLLIIVTGSVGSLTSFGGIATTFF